MDLISRQAAIDALKKAYWDKDLQAAKDDPCVIDAMTDWAIRQVKALPSAERRGRWIVKHGVLAGDGIYGDMGECSVCGLHLRNYEWDYCPNCGASMDEVSE